MSPALTHGLLASAAVVAGWWGWGWRGLLLAGSVIAFWLLLQFTRAVRVLRHAAQRPVGQVPSAVMLQARLEHGMSLQQVIALTGSLGVQVGAQDDWQWTDPGGHAVVVHLRRGRVVRWSLVRQDEEAPQDAAPPADPPAADPAPPPP